jgi:hypothetical protein
MSTPKSLLLLLILPVLLILEQCKNKNEDYTTRGKAFFNYQSGDLREYEIDSLAYEWSSGKLLKYRLLVKEKVLDTFTDLSGHVALRIEQYISRDTGRSYTFYKLSSVFGDAYGYQRVEENQRIVKMIVPINAKRKWDGNIYNGQGFQEFKYTGVGVPYSNNYLSSPDCVEVTQLDDSTVISRDKKVEVYGKDFGLFYKYEKSIEYNSLGQPQGYIVTWHLKRLLK